MSVNAIRVKDLDKVLYNLSRATADIKGANHKGMIKAGLLIQRESQRIVPIDTGNLRSSAFTIWNKPDTTVPLPRSAKRRLGQVTGPTVKRAFRTRKLNFQGSRSSGSTSTADYTTSGDKAQQENIKRLEQAQIDAKSHPIVEIGYAAFYAIFVHEDEEAQHKKGKFAKFLSMAISQNQKRIVDIIREEARKGAK